MSNLMLHCGASAVSEKELTASPTPKGTTTHTPVPHIDMVNMVRENAKEVGLTVVSEAFGLTKEGDRFFGLMEIVPGDDVERQYAMVLGLRNSHDKTLSAGLCVGSNVFVCDNLAFSGEVVLKHKHRSTITEYLPKLISRGIDVVRNKWIGQDRRMNAYMETDVSPEQAWGILMQGASQEYGALTPRLLPDVYQEFLHPTHEAFEGRSVWSLFNATTEHFKPRAVVKGKVRTEAVPLVMAGNSNLMARTTGLHRLMDHYCGLQYDPQVVTVDAN